MGQQRLEVLNSQWHQRRDKLTQASANLEQLVDDLIGEA